MGAIADQLMHDLESALTRGTTQIRAALQGAAPEVREAVEDAASDMRRAVRAAVQAVLDATEEVPPPEEPSAA